MPDEPKTAQVLPPVKKPDLMAGATVTPIVPRSIEEVFRVAKAVLMAGLAPDSYTRERGQDLPEDKVISRVVIGIMKGAEVRLPPITALSTIAIINNRPCLWGAGAMALIQSSGVLEKMLIEDVGERPEDEAETGKFARSYGKRVTLWRAGHAEPYSHEYTVGDAIRAHLWMNPKRTPWIEHPKDMLLWRAFSRAATKGFSDCLMGLAIREIIEDLPPDAPPPADLAFLSDEPAQIAAPTDKPINNVTPYSGASEPEPASTNHGESPPAAAGGTDAPRTPLSEPAPEDEPQLSLEGGSFPPPQVLPFPQKDRKPDLAAWCKVAGEIVSVAPTALWLDAWVDVNQTQLDILRTSGKAGTQMHAALLAQIEERKGDVRRAA